MLRSHFDKSFLVLLTLISFTILSGFILASARVSAEDDTVIDNVNITIPAACTMTGTGMNSHNATINNGTYASDIGTTTIKALCNDSDGFAIYAIGYTDDTDGKNVMTSDLGTDYDIQTGTGTSGNSQWAMKLATDSNATYPITIQNNYDSYHTVPDDFELVAKRTSFTDVGQNAVGASLTSTYQVFIANNQPAGTYIGQVKYTMVHPNDTYSPLRDDQVEVIFDGNGLTFPGGIETNRVVYGNTCSQMYKGATPTIIKSSNLANDGTKNSAYEASEVLQTVSVNGADKVLVEIDYELTNEARVTISEGSWNGWGDGFPDSVFYSFATWDWENEETDYQIRGTKTYVLDGDTITMDANLYDYPRDGYEYGVYAKVYPLYEIEQQGTEEITACMFGPVSGAYAEVTAESPWWDSRWGDQLTSLTSEYQVLDYIEKNKKIFSGTTITLSQKNPYRISFNGNGATAGEGSMDNYSISGNFDNQSYKLPAPNFFKTNYGFAGWSEDPNATVNGDSKIYGPNETISFSDLVYNSVDNPHHTILYAVWVPSAGNLQNWNNCSNLRQGQVTALTDQRDGNTYAVAKLADGNCWMIENLRLDAANSSDSTKAQGFGGVFTGLANSETVFNTTVANSKYSTDNITGDNQANRFPRYNNFNTSSPTNNMTSTNAYIRSYGNYYTWAAAKANTSYFTTITDSNSVNTSICPSGWRLPLGGENASESEYCTLFKNISNLAPTSSSTCEWKNASGNNAATEAFRNIAVFPNNFNTPGYWNSKSAYSRGSAAYYWTSTMNNGTNGTQALVAFYSSSQIIVHSHTGASLGGTVRCIKSN